MPAEVARFHCESQDHGLVRALDHQLIAAAAPALEKNQPVRLKYRIRNAHRSVGAMLSGTVARMHGHAGLPEDTLHVAFEGIAGQSFGAFLALGGAFELKGATNDYVGKGLSGARIVVRPPANAAYEPTSSIAVGNTTLYGATSGELFVRGRAGERFAVRNSGATAVVEGVGDHGCEYMTGGTVVILSAVGRNFAAGMTGGVAYVCDRKQAIAARTAIHDLAIEPLTLADQKIVRELVETHERLTGSRLARAILRNDPGLTTFKRVAPGSMMAGLGENACTSPHEKSTSSSSSPQESWRGSAALAV
jgi:glutamate synthase domain-containing protein 3